MQEPAKYDDILAAERKLEDAKRMYLQRFGWNCTCNMPGAYWLWRRDFAQEEASRRKWWEDAGGPLGKPSEPRPYGVITADTDMAVTMTRRDLDQDVDVDGEEE